MPETPAGLTLLNTWLTNNPGHVMIEASKDVPASVAVAPWHLAWFDTSDSSVVYVLPAPVETPSQKAERRKDELRVYAEYLWGTIPRIDFGQSGERTPRALAVDLWAAGLTLALTNDAVLTNDTAFGHMKTQLQVRPIDFQHGHSDHATTGWTTSLLEDRNIYLFTPSDTANSVLPVAEASLNNVLPANWASETNYAANINAIIAYLRGG